MPHYDKWTNEEDIKLKELYSNNTVPVISQILKRTKVAVRSRLETLKIRKPNIKTDYSTIPDNILAYIAGIIDGEGHIGIHKSKKKHPSNTAINYISYVVVLSVHNSDPRLINFLYNNLGGYKGNDKKPNSKNYFRWSISQRNVYNILKSLYKFLVIKKEQADTIFEFENTVLLSTKDKFNRLDENTTQTRLRLYNKLKGLHHIEYEIF